jgi:6-phospho-beta-glucosidase
LLGLVQHTAAYERLAATAALTRQEVDVKKALLAHPLIGQYAMAEELIDRMAAEVLA